MAKHIFDGILRHSSRVSCLEQTGLDIYTYWIYLRSRAWTMLAPVSERTRVPLTVSFILRVKISRAHPCALNAPTLFHHFHAAGGVPLPMLGGVSTVAMRSVCGTCWIEDDLEPPAYSCLDVTLDCLDCHLMVHPCCRCRCVYCNILWDALCALCGLCRGRCCSGCWSCLALSVSAGPLAVQSL
jgi:hypothetical protein